MSIGEQLRAWRERRRLSQMSLALDAGISTRHLSFVETGRSKPSRELILLLARTLELPLREINLLLVAGGYAPQYSVRGLDDPEMKVARQAVERIVQAHAPFPALAVDRYWHMLYANEAVAGILQGVSAELLQPPINVLRLSLHPDGLAGRILNLASWRRNVLERLRQQISACADARLALLLTELQTFPGAEASPAATLAEIEEGSLVVPLQLSVPGGVLNLIGTTTVFGTPLNVSLAEIAIESFFPADDFTRAYLLSSQPLANDTDPTQAPAGRTLN